MGKVFVGGLSRDTTTTGLRCYFERFGHISDCVVMKDRSTGAPRGFGFVTYCNQNSADHVIAQRHLIDGKEVEAKLAVPRDSDSLHRSSNASQTPSTTPIPSPAMSGIAALAPGELKIFVGGLSHETSETDFISYFETFGKVTDCVIMCDPHTRKPRGFGFITYDKSTSVERVCSNKFHDLKGERPPCGRLSPHASRAAGGGHVAGRVHAAHGALAGCTSASCIGSALTTEISLTTQGSSSKSSTPSRKIECWPLRAVVANTARPTLRLGVPHLLHGASLLWVLHLDLPACAARDSKHGRDQLSRGPLMQDQRALQPTKASARLTRRSLPRTQC